MSDGLAWLNGSFVGIEEARVSVEDRGFQFADGVYEMLRVYAGALFAAERHFERLRRSLCAIELEWGLSDADLQQVFDELVARSGLKEAQIYLQVTRGVMPREHKIRPGLAPTVVATVRPPRTVPEDVRTTGAAMITVPDERWGRCDIKATGLLPNVMAKNRAARKGMYDAIFVRNDVVTEATSSNVFIVLDGVLKTHPADHSVLNGVTRQLVLELAKAGGIAVQERPFFVEDLRSADEVFVTGTVTEVLGVTQVDSERIGTGKPGEITQQLYQAFQGLLPK